MTRLAAAILLLSTSAAGAGELRAGAAAVVITPPPGTPMAGYYHTRAADGVHDDLHAKALVIESGGGRAAIVALDLIGTTPDLVADARRAIEEATDLDGSAVLIAATHAHTGPVIAPTSGRAAAFGGATDQAKQYRAALPGLIAEAVRQAEAALAPATLYTARGREDAIAFNRRYHMRDGTVGWNPGKKNPNVIKPAGTIDPDVPILYVESADGRPIATTVNYAVHLDNVGGTQISADLPATLSRSLAAFKGDAMVTLFTAGCCGDVNHIDVNWAAPQGGHGNAARMGVILAGSVLRAWPELVPVAPGPVRVKREMVALELPPLAPGAVEHARAVADRAGSTDQPPTFLEMVEAFRVLDVAAREGKPIEAEVQVIAVGDALAWVSMPGEIFVELGLEIKQDSPFPHTTIAELANGSVGYVPSRRAYDQGAYEVISARVAEGSGERLVDAAVRLLAALHAEATAPPPPATASGTPP